MQRCSLFILQPRLTGPKKEINTETNTKEQWNMKMTVIPTVIGALGTFPKGLIKGLKHLEIMGQVKTIQTKALRFARIQRSMQQTWGDLLSFKLY